MEQIWNASTYRSGVVLARMQGSVLLWKEWWKKLLFGFFFALGKSRIKNHFEFCQERNYCAIVKADLLPRFSCISLSCSLFPSLSHTHTHTLSRSNSCSFFASRMYSYYHFFRWIYEPSCILLHRSTFSVRDWVRMLNYFQLKIRMWLAKPSWSDLTSEAQQLGIQAVLGWPTAQQL